MQTDEWKKNVVLNRRHVQGENGVERGNHDH